MLAMLTCAEYRLDLNAGKATVTGEANETSIHWTLKHDATVSVTGSSDDAGFSSWAALSGSGVIPDFDLIMEAGFAFNSASPSFDRTPYTDVEKNVVKFRHYRGAAEGVAPLGNNAGFNAVEAGKGEMLSFMVEGLLPNEFFVLTGYSLKDQNTDRIDLYYGQNCNKIKTTSANMDVRDSNIRLKNGERFGFAYNANSGARSALEGFSFEIITDRRMTLGLIE